MDWAASIDRNKSSLIEEAPLIVPYRSRASPIRSTWRVLGRARAHQSREGMDFFQNGALGGGPCHCLSSAEQKTSSVLQVLVRGLERRGRP